MIKHIPTFALVAIGSYFIPSGVGIARFKTCSLNIKLVIVFCCFMCSEVVVELFLSLNHINNIFLSNLSFLVEPAFLSVIYIFSVEKKRTRNLLGGLAVLFVVVWLIDKMLYENPQELNNPMAAASRIFIIAISIFVLHSIMKNTDRSLVDDPIFWISTGWIIYSAGVFLVFGLSEELMKAGLQYFVAAWYINWTLLILSNLMFTKGLLCKVKR